MSIMYYCSVMLYFMHQCRSKDTNIFFHLQIPIFTENRFCPDSVTASSSDFWAFLRSWDPHMFQGKVEVVLG